MADSIVVDTSVLISALIGPVGLSREIIRRCLNGGYIPLVSNALFQEYEAVSSRTEVRKLCPLSSDEVTELLNAFYSVCHWMPIYYLWRPNLPDNDDNFLVELAIAGNATCIVTNNIKDIKSSELTFKDLQVLTPKELLRG
ncbi:MAG: putative toxin-antitoxin system toxin component, PIN family [Proteobacteria bacterium]|nr:putative toxin-antitoxin system toxin component, PIN family [Pseudomonadota bacterium]